LFLIFLLGQGEGISMLPTFGDGDIFLIEAITWKYFGQPLRVGDVIMFRSPFNRNEHYCKRIVALVRCHNSIRISSFSLSKFVVIYEKSKIYTFLSARRFHSKRWDFQIWHSFSRLCGTLLLLLLLLLLPLLRTFFASLHFSFVLLYYHY
jgi:hypothetical protein